MGFFDFLRSSNDNIHIIDNGYEPSYTLFNTSDILGKKKKNFPDPQNWESWYDSIPEVKIVVDYKASMFSNIEFKIVDEEGNHVENKEVERLLKSPNPTQSWKEFVSLYQVQRCVRGNNYMYKNAIGDGLPKTLWFLPPNKITPVTTGYMYTRTKIDEIVSHYEQSVESKKPIIYDTKDILHIKGNTASNKVTSESPLMALKMPISNIKAAYEARNIHIDGLGAMGILSNESNDGTGNIPITHEDKDRIQKGYKARYGKTRGKDQVIVTNSKVKFQSIAYPVKDLMLFEEVESDFKRIIDAFGLNYNLFSNEDGSTYENVQASLRMVYENTIIPEAQDFANMLTGFLGLENQRIVASYDHVAALQEDKKREAEVFQTTIDSLNSMFDRQIITREEYLTLLNDERL